MYLFKNVTVFDGEKLVEKQNVLWAKNRIIDVFGNSLPLAHQVSRSIDGQGNILAPGFIDLQTNGGGGVLWNDSPDVVSLQKIQQAHLQFGTTSLLPTLISDNSQKMSMALTQVQKAIEKEIPGILGIHLEGPYLNTNKKGIHNKNFIRPPTQNEVDEICSSSIPIKLITLAPEIVSAEIIKKFSQNKVLVFAGHTNATFAQMSQARAHGVAGITHFFNACSAFTSQDPGVVGAGIWYEDLWCGLIADGLHVCYDTIKIAFQAKGTRHFVLVSDSMSLIGTNGHSFQIQGENIFLTGHKLQNAQGVLAGSNITIWHGLKNIVENQCASLPSALAMSSTNPARCLQLENAKGRIYPNYEADFVLLDKNNLDIMVVVQAGDIIQCQV